jgi:YbgC/YbaW family acyl-CoA thioester hydrolase
MNDRYFEVPVRVHWADTDMAGIVYFANFLKYFEAAEDALFEALGKSRLTLYAALPITMPRVEVTCRFRSPARAEDELLVGIAIAYRTARRIAFEFQVWQRRDRRLVAEGSYLVACVDRAAFTGIEFPPEVMQLLDGLPALIARQRAHDSP